MAISPIKRSRFRRRFARDNGEQNRFQPDFNFAQQMQNYQTQNTPIDTGGGQYRPIEQQAVVARPQLTAPPTEYLGGDPSFDMRAGGGFQAPPPQNLAPTKPIPRTPPYIPPGRPPVSALPINNDALIKRNPALEMAVGAEAPFQRPLPPKMPVNQDMSYIGGDPNFDMRTGLPISNQQSIGMATKPIIPTKPIPTTPPYIPPNEGVIGVPQLPQRPDIVSPPTKPIVAPPVDYLGGSSTFDERTGLPVNRPPLPQKPFFGGFGSAYSPGNPFAGLVQNVARKPLPTRYVPPETDDEISEPVQAPLPPPQQPISPSFDYRRRRADPSVRFNRSTIARLN